MSWNTGDYKAKLFGPAGDSTWSDDITEELLISFHWSRTTSWNVIKLDLNKRYLHNAPRSGFY